MVIIMNRRNQIIPIEEDMLPYVHWLYNVPGVGNITMQSLLARIGTPDIVYRLSEKELDALLCKEGRNQKLKERILQSRQKWNVEENYRQLGEKQIRFTCLGHRDYPARLLEIPNAPYGLYYRGKLPDEKQGAVAMIGARNCSEYGRRMAQTFGRELAMAGIQIISGMARGVDGIGQKEALAAGGYSLGVMGCGVDICYPKENRELYDMLCIQGGICSEYPPGTEPKNTLFPPRNRIISGFADIVLVVEAKHRSGTLITVDMALEQGKEIYALPGRVTDALSEGCNRLVQQGAGAALTPQDILYALAGRRQSGQPPIIPQQIEQSPQISQQIRQSSFGRPLEKQRQKEAQGHFLPEIQREILQSLDDTPQSVEIIKERMLSKFQREMTLPELMNQLVKLSLCGLAKQIGGSYFVRG
ncbi:MAG: DNA-processing protein DprA [Muribaculaceae bacterium]|nr:DNA-processing protein DprA [Muribaculaceae bacterium]